MGFLSCMTCWSAGHETPTAAGRWGSARACHVVAVQQLERSLVGSWDGDPGPGNARADTIARAFENFGGSDNSKDCGVR